MDDTPKHFLEEIRTSILRKRVGQIALAVVIAEAVWRLIRAITWYLVIPIVARILQGNTESVLLSNYRGTPLPWDSLAGSIVEFLFTIIVVFYLNRWIHQKESKQPQAEAEFSTVGEPVVATTSSSAEGETP